MVSTELAGLRTSQTQNVMRGSTRTVYHKESGNKKPDDITPKVKKRSNSDPKPMQKPEKKPREPRPPKEPKDPKPDNDKYALLLKLKPPSNFCF